MATLVVRSGATEIKQGESDQVYYRRTWSDGTVTYDTNLSTATVSNPDALILSPTGKITGGNVTADTPITITGSNSETVVVNVKPVTVTAIAIEFTDGNNNIDELSSKQLKLIRTLSDSTTLEGTIFPSGYVLAASDSTILQVTPLGLVTGGQITQNRTAKITVANSSLSGVLPHEYTVTVVASPEIGATELSYEIGLVGGGYQISENKSGQLAIFRTWSDGTITTDTDFTGMTITSSNDSILLADPNGYLLAGAVATDSSVNITVDTGSGLPPDVVAITVKNVTLIGFGLAVTGGRSNTSLRDNTTAQLKVTRNYSDGTIVASEDFTGITLVSSSTSALEVDSAGVLTSHDVLANTDVVITATAGALPAVNLTVTVINYEITSFSIAPVSGTVLLNETGTDQIKITRLYSDETSTVGTDTTDITFASSNGTVLAVDAAGVLTPGNVTQNTVATITATHPTLGDKSIDITVASVPAGGSTLVSTVLRTTDNLDWVEEGPTHTKQLAHYKTWSDGTITTSTVFTGITLTSTNPDALAVNSTGRLTAGNVIKNTRVTISDGTNSIIYTVIAVPASGATKESTVLGIEWAEMVNPVTVYENVTTPQQLALFHTWSDGTITTDKDFSSLTITSTDDAALLSSAAGLLTIGNINRDTTVTLDAGSYELDVNLIAVPADDATVASSAILLLGGGTKIYKGLTNKVFIEDTYTDGTIKTDPDITSKTLTSSNTTVATVAANGTLTVGTSGFTTISSNSDAAPITLSAVVQSGWNMQLVGGATSINELTSAQLEIVREWDDGSTTVDTNFTSVSLLSLNPSVATVTTSGLVTSVSDISSITPVTIQANAGEKSLIISIVPVA